MLDPAKYDDIAIGLLTGRLRRLEHHLSTAPTPLDGLVQAALEAIPGASGVSVTTLRQGAFVTEASTDQRTLDADRLQYDLSSGPCVDAIRRDRAYNSGDLRHDERWPEFGRRVAQEQGINSCLSYQLAVDITGHRSCLNVYGDAAGAFDDEAVVTALVFATHAVTAITTLYAESKITNLEKALEGSRQIGIAIGVLMARRQLTREDAFDYLRLASQMSNQKVRDLAGHVAETGGLPASVAALFDTEGAGDGIASG